MEVEKTNVMEIEVTEKGKAEVKEGKEPVCPGMKLLLYSGYFFQGVILIISTVLLLNGKSIASIMNKPRVSQSVERKVSIENKASIENKEKLVTKSPHFSYIKGNSGLSKYDGNIKGLNNVINESVPELKFSNEENFYIKESFVVILFQNMPIYILHSSFFS
jgi:hypothetical protein